MKRPTRFSNVYDKRKKRFLLTQYRKKNKTNFLDMIMQMPIQNATSQFEAQLFLGEPNMPPPQNKTTTSFENNLLFGGSFH